MCSAVLSIPRGLPLVHRRSSGWQRSSSLPSSMNEPLAMWHLRTRRALAPRPRTRQRATPAPSRRYPGAVSARPGLRAGASISAHQISAPQYSMKFLQSWT